MKKRFEIKIILIVALLGLLPANVYGETLISPNYNIENPSFATGGTSGSSTNYKSFDAAGSAEGGSASSSAYKYNGYILPLFPGVPGVPTLINTGGSLYNTLDFVVNNGGDSVDTNFAIAISTDSFVTTNYVQANDDIGSSAVWQTYSAWGSSSGQRLINLAPNTTYQIKIKARYGADSETGFSSTVSASTVNPTLTLTIAGVNTGTTVAGVTTNVTTSSQAVTFTNLQTGSIKLAAQLLTVSTNATGGYTVSMKEDHDLQKTNGNSIAPVVATNAVPAAWPSGVTQGRFGYHTTDSSLCTGTTTRFSVNDTFAAATTSSAEVMCGSSAVTNDQANILFKVEIEALQPPGDYVNQITYITTAQY